MYATSQQRIQEAPRDLSADPHGQISSNRSLDMQGITPIPQNYYIDDLKECLRAVPGRKTVENIKNFIENPRTQLSYFRTIFLAHFLQSYLILQQNKLSILKYLGVDAVQAS